MTTKINSLFFFLQLSLQHPQKYLQTLSLAWARHESNPHQPILRTWKNWVKLQLDLAGFLRWGIWSFSFQVWHLAQVELCTILGGGREVWFWWCIFKVSPYLYWCIGQKDGLWLIQDDAAMGGTQTWTQLSLLAWLLNVCWAVKVSQLWLPGCSVGRKAAAAASEVLLFFSLVIFDIINGMVSFLFVWLFKSFLVIIEPSLAKLQCSTCTSFVPWM